MTHTHSKIQLHYFWPGMLDFIRDKITAFHKCIVRKSPVKRQQPMGHVPVSGKFERVAMDLLDVSVISGKGHKYILVVCDYFTKYTEAYPLMDKTARSVADALMDKWLPTFGFTLFSSLTVRKGTMTVRPWRAHFPLDAGYLDTSLLRAKINYVHHGLDHTK